MPHFFGTTDGPHPRATLHDDCLVYHRGSGTPEDFVRAWRARGEDLHAHRTGEFAIALHDRTAGSWILTADALGLTPLYYTRTATGLRFASQLDLLRHAGIGDLDDDYLSRWLLLGFPIDDRTPFRDVRRLLPGSTLVWKDGRLRERKSYDLARVRPIERMESAEAEARFRDLVREGVVEAAKEGPVWAELSGGLDSSTIVSAAAHAGLPIEELSILYPKSRRVDETEFMRAVLDAWPIPWHTLDGDAAPAFSEMPATSRYPFGAHVWVEVGGRIVHDHPDQPRVYARIAGL